VFRLVEICGDVSSRMISSLTVFIWACMRDWVLDCSGVEVRSGGMEGPASEEDSLLLVLGPVSSKIEVLAIMLADELG
jgi:hypothetical protein